MSANTVRVIASGGTTAAIAGLLSTDGSRAHQHLARLIEPDTPVRDLADALHLLCMLHARYPGVFDLTLASHRDQPIETWLRAAATGFAQERHWLTILVAAIGPLPSTPGQAESEAAVAAQRHALDTLARSERVGCAIGAAAALLLDWPAIRALMDAAAERLAIEIAAVMLPDPVDTTRAVDAFIVTPGAQRAASFGAQQLLAQHRGMWDLLDARASARKDT